MVSFYDIILIFIIFSVFLSIIGINGFSMSLSAYKKDWPVIRCNPVVMPFASLFDESPTDNFVYCVQDMQKNFMSTLLKPINYSFDVIGEVASSMLSSIEGIRNMIDKIRTFLEDIVGGIFGAIINIIIEFQNITMKIKDMIMKLVGVLAVILFTLDGTMKTMLSLWNGIPGQLVRAL